MYAIFENQNLIGYHSKKSIVEKFYNDQKDYGELRFEKIKEKKLEKYPGYEERYLIRYGTSYIPAIYDTVMVYQLGEQYCELKTLEELLEKVILHNKELSHKKENSLLKAREIITDLKDDLLSAPSIKELQQLQGFLEEYQNQVENSCFYTVEDWD